MGTRQGCGCTEPSGVSGDGLLRPFATGIKIGRNGDRGCELRSQPLSPFLPSLEQSDFIASLQGRQQARLYNGQLPVEVGASAARAPASGGGEIAQEIALEIDAKRLPGEADSTAREGNIVARLDTIQVLKEEATTRKAALLVVLRFEQEMRAPHKPRIIRLSLLLAVARPEIFLLHPAIAQSKVIIARRPRIGQRLARVLLEQAITLLGQVIERPAQRALP